MILGIRDLFVGGRRLELVTNRSQFHLFLCIFVGSVTFCEQRSVRNATMDALMSNTTDLLDNLLAEENYDRQIRPGFGGEPTIILTDIEIRSFGPISETDMIYSMDCYFRQTWWDRRLKFSREGLPVLSMDWKFLQRVWTPDTYFLNGKSSHLHKVTVPNKFIRVRQDGQLKYSMRVTIEASCPMHLRKYPLDSQACPLEIGSFAYTTKDVIYRWKSATAVELSKDTLLSQYDFLNITTGNRTSPIGPSGGQRSSLTVRFILQRRRGYFILQIYAPCAMIVGASWVSFWINWSDAAGRVAVGAMTVLTLVTMGFTGRRTLPRVNYATAIDWFIIMCFTFVFAAMVEYACVNFVDRYESEKIRKRLLQKRVAAVMAKRDAVEANDKESHQDIQVEHSERVRLSVDAEDSTVRRGLLQRVRSYFRRKRKQRYREMNPLEAEGVLRTNGIASRVDAYARLAFPITFTVLNILYWTLFLYIIDDEIADDVTI